MGYLRNYKVDTILNAQEGWKVETRIRISGKQAGSSYKCFKAPTGTCYWSLRKAKENGFKGYASSNSGQFRSENGSVKTKKRGKKGRGKKP